MFKRKVLLLIFITALILTGCNQNNHASSTSVQNSSVTAAIKNITEISSSIRQKPGYITAEGVIKKLASNEFKGRLTGTDENKKAAEYIADLFNTIGLEKYDKNTYMLNYKHKFPDDFSKPEYRAKTIDAQHVVGVIPGENHSKAVIITAHFDHIGADENGNSYLGAMDDASGISALINLAQLLKAYGKPLSQDIVICALNGEEEGLQAAETFVNDVTRRYKSLYNIDFDCIGSKEDDTLLVMGDDETSEELIDQINDYLTEKGEKTSSLELEDNCFKKKFKISGTKKTITAGAGTNSIAFSIKGISTVSLGQNCISGESLNKMNMNENTVKNLIPKPYLIHSLEDTPDKIDFKFIERVSDEVGIFIIKNDGIIFE